MPNREFPTYAPVDLSRRSSSTKRIHMTTSLGKDTSSAKITKMTGCISGNHGLWVCNQRLRGSNNGFTSRRSFCESVRRLRPKLRCCFSVCLNLRESAEVKYKTMCLLKTKAGISSLFSQRWFVSFSWYFDVNQVTGYLYLSVCIFM
ncbi:uncharacterized protein LOC111207487 isoform X2 [Brassica napus]|uniref:uncharacterized protein LOC111207487 isoform X2 n=1 Tax=Brassica napus TaxID=3708 RepID=UPI000BBE65F1|nr:uncharacterized protein LOC111207487 isoform X2 [Brassica napus]